MPRCIVDGVALAYEIIGDGMRTAAITPGGRFSKDAPGIHELAQGIAAGGFRVLIWDRPNCGESDIRVSGPSESLQNANMLAGLLRALDMGPALLVGGSGGARETLLTAIHHPDVVERAFILWLSGGAVGIATLPSFYCADALIAATHGGMAEVAELPGWQEPLMRHPPNRDRLLALDPDAFIGTMTAWAEAFFPQSGAPIPCATTDQLARIAMPVMLLRSGASDMHHSRATSEAVAALIPGARLAEPPWGDGEWVERLVANLKGEAGLFSRWPLLAPMILDFAAGV
ncbi:alpha/beta hydrolase [Sphingobium sp. BYY-5]|uniref:alpha/beta fold hydrolase n=1 Tax=Sphingobium sp. BYY-5 TaxID=2926400 RepID=UPI001FA6D508|nr:alpha/beta hydrolase [Sphingobium sp. BYY-5]MCI4592343.1 alpha/beta hydrolase [Sphingobium sp. BYY-5]